MVSGRYLVMSSWRNKSFHERLKTVTVLIMKQEHMLILYYDVLPKLLELSVKVRLQSNLWWCYKDVFVQYIVIAI